MRLHRVLGAAAYVYRHSDAFHSPRSKYNSPSRASASKLSLALFHKKTTLTSNGNSTLLAILRQQNDKLSLKARRWKCSLQPYYLKKVLGF